MAVALTDVPPAEYAWGTALPVAIYLLDRATHDLRLLVENGTRPVWSLDGCWLADVTDLSTKRLADNGISSPEETTTRYFDDTCSHDC